MGIPAKSPRVLRFGVFEVDLQACELRKAGLKVKLQVQPFQVLVALLERPGEVVTRDDLRQRLWPTGTFVDFDHSLNSAIKKLRIALGDDSESPRYIETLHRRGYRLIVPVATASPRLASINETPANLHSENTVHGRSSPEEESSPLQKLSPRGTAVAKGKIRSLVGVVATAVLVVLAIKLLSQKTQVQVTGYTQITNDGWPKSAFRVPRQGIFVDGRRIYSQEIRNDRFVLAEVSVTGGDVAPLTLPFANTLVFDISPDKSRLLVGFEIANFSDAVAFWALPLPTGPPRRIGEISGQSAAWSHDGKYIFFGHGRELYVAKDDGSGPRRLLFLDGYPFWIRSSPDGQTLRFSVFDPHTDSVSLWESGADGAGLRRLFVGWHTPPQECCGSWTVDGKYYVFQTSPRSGPRDLWIVKSNNNWQRRWSKPSQLTNGPLEFSSPQPSEDGTTLYALGLRRRSELVRYSPDQGFVPFLKGVDAAAVSFSKDGQWIAFVSTSDSTLWRSKIDGGERLQLTYPPMDVMVPVWSPDGQQIAFMGQMPGKQKQALLISSVGGVPRQVVPGAFASGDPGWSPDGSALVLSLTESEGEMGGIFVVDLRSMTRSPLLESKNLFSPRWSPNGKYVVALSEDEKRLVLFDPLTLQWKELAYGWIGCPTWSHDSKYVYFDTLGENASFSRVRISDGKLDRLVSLTDIRRFWSNWEPWSGLAPDDSLLVLRDLGTQEVYALNLRRW